MPALAPAHTPFGKFIRGRRIELGLSAVDVATIVDVHQTTISRWERGLGIRDIQGPQLTALAEALDEPRDVLHEVWVDTLRDLTNPGLLSRLPFGLRARVYA